MQFACRKVSIYAMMRLLRLLLGGSSRPHKRDSCTSAAKSAKVTVLKAFENVKNALQNSLKFRYANAWEPC